MRFVPSFVRGGESSKGAVSCVTAPYWGLVQAWGECCGDFGVGWSKRWRHLEMYVGEVDGALVVVPLELDAEVQFAGPVGGHLVLRSDHVAKVLGVFLADVLDAEVVDD